jgi:8-oxo-dGTP pyrophosphatase MutT (NUDIX family)
MEEVEGVVIALYKEMDGYYRFAVLRRERNWEGWELVKGRMDGEENPADAARREVIEETGIDPEDITALDSTHEWTYERDGTEYHARYHTFLARAPQDAYITVSQNDEEEHSKGHFLNLRDTLDILTHDNQQELVQQAVEHLKE